ncbi:hypothetical protein BCR34DRAFT_554387 [Clohesyomyces aquaticus]|uniref:DUF6590 domain-containing protein n=1 Tax=Clohesyomyces aquaticus TaxID=1231657 RepID=A0A1Y2A6T9_9PLEO|nr:hypothetical protein BCR34DRAFT_554387 [Clohesyomyces aquaticus]
MSDSNTWEWSEPHQNYYRLVYDDKIKKWDFIWAKGTGGQYWNPTDADQTYTPAPFEPTNTIANLPRGEAHKRVDSHYVPQPEDATGQTPLQPQGTNLENTGHVHGNENQHLPPVASGYTQAEQPSAYEVQQSLEHQQQQEHPSYQSTYEGYPNPQQRAPNPSHHAGHFNSQHGPGAVTYLSNRQTDNRPLDSGIGQTVEGMYGNPKAPPNVPHYEPLDNTYYVRERKFFVVGKMFSVLFPEPTGGPPTRYNDSASFATVRFGEQVHAQIRRFIIVQCRKEYCYACPVFTYSGRGTLKPGVRAHQHSIVYNSGYAPTPLQGETGMNKNSIEIIGVPGTSPLNQASRIYFGIQHPIQYNVRVKDLGQVIESHIPRLLGYWRLENDRSS